MGRTITAVLLFAVLLFLELTVIPHFTLYAPPLAMVFFIIRVTSRRVFFFASDICGSCRGGMAFSAGSYASRTPAFFCVLGIRAHCLAGGGYRAHFRRRGP